jgi:hypothetical protein
LEQPATAQENQLPYNPNDPEIQKAMVEEFSRQSGMKIDWAKKCLEDLAWNFEVNYLSLTGLISLTLQAAGNAFNEFRSQLPSDAFI